MEIHIVNVYKFSGPHFICCLPCLPTANTYIYLGATNFGPFSGSDPGSLDTGDSELLETVSGEIECSEIGKIVSVVSEIGPSESVIVITYFWYSDKITHDFFFLTSFFLLQTDLTNNERMMLMLQVTRFEWGIQADKKTEGFIFIFSDFFMFSLDENEKTFN